MNKYINYLRFFKARLLFTLTLKKIPGEMKSNYKNYIFYSCLKRKYESFLKNYKPQINQVHEYSNKIWWCWLQGEGSAPELCRTCLNSIRKNCPEHEIIIITEENYLQYVEFPDFVLEKYKKGIISKTHFSDLLRLQLLIKHGGVWIDSTCYLSEKPEYIFNTPLFSFKNNERGDSSIAASSWLISSEKSNSILTLTRDMLFDWWKKHNHLYHYFLVHFFFTMACSFYKNEWQQVPFYSNLPCHILQRELFNKYNVTRFNQIKKMSAVHKLTYKFKDKETEGTFYEYLLKN